MTKCSLKGSLSFGKIQKILPFTNLPKTSLFLSRGVFLSETLFLHLQTDGFLSLIALHLQPTAFFLSKPSPSIFRSIPPPPMPRRHGSPTSQPSSILLQQTFFLFPWVLLTIFKKGSKPTDLPPESKASVTTASSGLPFHPNNIELLIPRTPRLSFNLLCNQSSDPIFLGAIRFVLPIGFPPVDHSDNRTSPLFIPKSPAAISLRCSVKQRDHNRVIERMHILISSTDWRWVYWALYSRCHGA